jgi:hypothetical protein
MFTCREEGDKFNTSRENDIVSKIGADITEWKLNAIIVGIGSNLEYSNKQEYSKILEIFEDSESTNWIPLITFLTLLLLVNHLHKCLLNLIHNFILVFIIDNCYLP